MQSSAKERSPVLEILSEEELSVLDPARIPQHIAIIPDGNRRWARNRHLSPEMGHHRGADSLTDIVKAAKDIGVKVLTIYGFSTENSSRPAFEVDALMFIMERYLVDKREDMVNSDIRCRSIGDIAHLPSSLIKALRETEAATAHCQSIDFVLALNYGGRDDIRRGVTRLVEDCMAGKIDKSSIDETVIAQYLDTAAWPDPDMMIRTSGEIRISNFLLWQASYTELCPLDVYWPDFTPQHLLKAVGDFQNRNRRHGS
ncbi:MAG: di-trans,poly-cis-decaprenylcistransferase [Chlamydiia bacterium]|nr:di-trans,poly-cis-decaprenylcistransferase [Chlamydiia bacterium]